MIIIKPDQIKMKNSLAGKLSPPFGMFTINEPHLNYF